MSISANFPNVRPSLLLDFAQSQQLDPRVTFSRSTTALYYDGKTSVLAEQNTTLNSSSLSGQLVLSTGSATVTYNSTTAPDGTTTATSIVPTNGATIAIYYIGNGPTNSAYSYTVSIYVKANGMNYVAIGTSNASSIVIEANLSTGVVSGGSGSVVSAGNGWYRIIATFSSYNNGTYYLQVRDTSGTTTLSTANGTNGIYVWGAQSEQRSSVTAYNATTTSAITNYIPQLLTAPINAPRFDFNPTTGESLGLLIEQSSTNLQTYSQDFSNAGWAKTNITVTSGADIAPDGTQTFQKLVESTATGLHYVSGPQQVLSIGTAYTTSFYVKSAGRNYIAAAGDAALGSLGGFTGFDLTNGTVVSNGSGVTSSSIASVGNGVYRCSITATATNTVGDVSVVLRTTSGSGTQSYTGDGYSGIYIWGAQLEALALATSYIQTTSAQVTRAADVAQMTGTNFSSWYNNAQGTFFTEGAGTQSNAGATMTVMNSTYTNYAISMFYSSAYYVLSYPSGNSMTFTASSGINTKQSFAYTSTNIVGSLNGSVTQSIANASNPALATLLTIGNYFNFSIFYNGRIKKLAYYPQALTSAQLQSLTGS